MSGGREPEVPWGGGCCTVGYNASLVMVTCDTPVDRLTDTYENITFVGGW